MEKTLVMLKPNAFTLKIIGEVLLRIERSKFKIVAMKMFCFNQKLAGEFYAEHRGKAFFKDLTAFMTSGPTIALIAEAENAIVKMRTLVGATNPANAAPGTIRYDYAPNGAENVIHASDSEKSAAREIGLLFSPGDSIAW